MEGQIEGRQFEGQEIKRALANINMFTVLLQHLL